MLVRSRDSHQDKFLDLSRFNHSIEIFDRFVQAELYAVAIGQTAAASSYRIRVLRHANGPIPHVA